MSALSRLEQFTGSSVRDQATSFLVATGHSGIHWIVATVFVLLPFLQESLGLSYTEAGLIASLFHFSSFSANVASGAIVDLSGKRVLIQALSLTVGAFALIVIGVGGTLYLIIPAIIVMGFTNNIWHPAAITFLSQRYPRNKGLALSIHTLGATMGDIFAPLFAGSLLVIFSWQTVAPMSALPVLLVAALLYILLRGQRFSSEAGDRKKQNLSSYFRGLKSLIVDRALIGVCLVTGFRAMGQNGLQVFVPLYLVGVLSASPFVLGFSLMALQVGGVIAGPLAGIWSDRIGRRTVILIGSALTTLILGIMTFVDSLVPFVGILFVLGFAIFSLRPVIHSWVMDLASENVSGSAVSVLFSAQSGFTVIVPLIGGAFADVWGLASVFYLFTGFMLISTLIAYLLPDSRESNGQ